MPVLSTAAFTSLLFCVCLAFPTSNVPEKGQTDKKIVAVLYFDNQTGENRYDPFGKGLASMMISDLSVVDQIQLVEREHLQSLIEEMKLQQSEFFDSEKALEIGNFLGAQYIVTGSITSAKPEVRLDTRVIQIETAEIVKTAAAVGPDDELFQIQRQLADALIDGLGLVLSPEEQERLHTQQEANRIDDVETTLAFSEGLDLYDRGDYLGAAERMNEVRQRAPSSQLVTLTYEVIKEDMTKKGKAKVQDKLNSGIRSGIRKRLKRG